MVVITYFCFISRRKAENARHRVLLQLPLPRELVDVIVLEYKMCLTQPAVSGRDKVYAPRRLHPRVQQDAVLDGKPTKMHCN